MQATEERYYKINQIVLMVLGIWPYQQSYFTQIQKAFFASVLLTFILVQLLVFVTTQCNAYLLLKILSIVFPFLFVTIKYCLFIIQADSVKQMLDRIRDDWKSLKDKVEIDIIKKYAHSIWFSSIISIVVLCACSLILFTLQCLPLILDVILPLNESRSFQLIVITEYFINQDKYIYIILFHEALACFVAEITLCGTLITMMTFIWHSCALFKIACYRMENAIEKSALTIPIFERQYLFYQRIIHAVFIHRKAIEFAELFTSNFTVLFAILIVVGVSSLSINLFQITLIDNRTEDAYIIPLLIAVHLNYMFIINYGGQKMTDYEKELFKVTYNGLWYTAPLRIQKLLLFIMLKGYKDVTLIFGGMYIVSLQGFASLTNAAISYFMVMHSTKK
ncbi:Odorant receptor 347 [Nylanderia fulva]|uniref:Odorant receptor n=1 Tax=Nylanderia fulva TaxID=613905 RepID=A0A6G1LQ48_9HYME|nr:Odorant receptor 347 [Nylanderia fulva]